MAKDLFYNIAISADKASYDLSRDLSSLTIAEDTTGPDKLTIELSDPYKVFSHAFQEGMLVTVDLGRADDHSLIFRGHLYKVEGEFPTDSIPTLKLLAYDTSMKMGLKKRNRVWTNTSLKGIVSDIAKPYFGANVSIRLKGDPNFNGNGIRQQDETDLAFLRRLATQYGCELFVVAGEEKDTLHFEAQHSIMQGKPQVTLYYGRCGVADRLLAFQASSDVSNIQLPRVFAGIDYESGQQVEVTTAPVEKVGSTDDTFFDENLTELGRRSPKQAEQLDKLLQAAGTVQEKLRKELGSEEREVTPGFVTQKDLQVRADNQFSTSIHGMRANGTAEGNHRLHAQAPIEIADVGGRFSGIWYVAQVQHMLSGQGYRTEFECRR